jgi:protein phosphatase PTC6
MVLVTDGVSSMISNQEIVDLARTSPDPTKAAEDIVGFAEHLGAQDNCTCIVVPLAGWGNVGGKDETKDRRDYRRRKAGEQSFKMERSQRM